jgi:hypothetical protein
LKSASTTLLALQFRLPWDAGRPGDLFSTALLLGFRVLSAEFRLRESMWDSRLASIFELSLASVLEGSHGIDTRPIVLRVFSRLPANLAFRHVSGRVSR